VESRTCHSGRGNRRRIANLTEAVEGGTAVAPLVVKLKARQPERDELLAAIGAADAITKMTLDRN